MHSFDFYIVVSRNAPPAEKFAASELQKYLYKSTGICYPYFDDRVEKKGREIRVGFGARNEAYKIDKEQLGNEGFLIRTLPGGDILIAGNSPRGTIYGVYSFLEKSIGFKAFTGDVEKFDFRNSPKIDNIDTMQIPAFEYRDVYFRPAFNAEFCIKNKLNLSMADISERRGGCMRFHSVGHTFWKLIPAETYFEEHPEYFALSEGKRAPEQPCLTNPRVFEIVRKNLIDQIKKNPDCNVFSVAQNDVPLCCECEECRKINEREGSEAGTNIWFVNKLAESIEKDYPHVLLHTFAYRFTKTAPKYLKPKDNVIVRLCNIECDWSRPFEDLAKDESSATHDFLKNIEEWSKIAKRLYVWDYAVNFHNYPLPFPNIYQMAANIKMFAEKGVSGLLEQGNYSFGGGAALDELKVYLAARLMWDPKEDARQIVNEFCDHVYGRGGRYISEYIDLMTEAVSGYKMTLYDNADAPYFTDELVRKCTELFEKARSAAESEAVLERIEKESLSVEYLRIVRMEDDKKRKEEVEKFAEKLRRCGITEIMEKTALADSLDFMKERYATKRFHRYDYLRYEIT